MNGQVQTERGLLHVAETFDTPEQAKDAGYSYAFHSSQIGKDLYSKCLDDRGLRHSFSIVEKGVSNS